MATPRPARGGGAGATQLPPPARRWGVQGLPVPGFRGYLKRVGGGGVTRSTRLSLLMGVLFWIQGLLPREGLLPRKGPDSPLERGSYGQVKIMLSIVNPKNKTKQDRRTLLNSDK